MQTAGGGFAAAVTAQDQVVDYKVTIGFPAGVQASYQDVTKSVVSIDKDRSVTTAFSDQSTLVSGFASAQATVVLSGLLNQNPGVALAEAQSIWWLFNRNDPTSPMRLLTCAGLDITIKEGLWDGGTTSDLVTTFTGTIDTVSISNGVVTLQCRDQRSSVTSQATLPPVITSPPYNAGLTSEYALDYLLRHSSPAKYYTWPAQRASCLLAVGFRSSLWPEVGSYSSIANVPSFAPGMFGTAFSNSAALNASYTLASTIAPAETYFFEAFVTGGGSGNFEVNLADAAATYQIVFEWLGDGFLNVFTISPSGAGGAAAIDTGAATGEHYVALKATWPSGSSTVTCAVRLDNTTYGPFTVTATNTRPSTLNFSLALIGAGSGTIEGVQITKETSPAFNDAFTPTLFIDPSLSALTAIPDVASQDDWSVVQDIAAAEAGVFLFDELGVPRFYNRDTIAAKTSVRTITSTKSLVNLDSQEQMSLCATHIQAPAKQYTIQPFNTVWQLGTQIFVASGATYTAIVDCGNPIVNLGTTCVILPGGGVLVAGTSGYRAAYGIDGAGPVTNLTMTVTQVGTSTVKVTVYNPNGAGVWLVSPQGTTYPDASDGQPILRVGAQAITSDGAGVDGDTTTSASGVIADAQWPPASVGGATTNADFGEVLYQVSDSDWRQDITSAQDLANDLLVDLHYPKPIWRNVDIIPDPRLQLLDVVTVTDTDVTLVNADAQIIGITTRLAAGEYSQQIDAVATAPPGAWLLGIAGHSEFNTTTYLY